MKKLLTIFFIFIFSFFLSCEKNMKISTTDNSIETEAYENREFERIGFPVKLHFIERSGMKYMIASGTTGEAGTSITNLTLDSLQVEFYKRSLNNR